MVLLRQDGWESLSHVSPRLGESPESDYEQFGYQLQPGEVLVIFTEGVRDAADAQGCPLGEAGVAEAVLGHSTARPRSWWPWFADGWTVLALPPVGATARCW